jgi:hypothetical protein
MKTIKISTYLFVLSICIVLIGLIRFNRNDPGISNLTRPDATYDKLKSNDAIRYINMTDYFRGKESPDLLIPPYTTRILIPFVASLLPFEADTSINLINLLCMIGSMFVLYRIMLLLGITDRYRLIGCVIYVFSFPTFYYGTVTYVDASLIFFLFVGLYFILTDNLIGLIITIVFGTMTKESAILLIPVFFIHNLGSRRMLLNTLLLAAAYFATVFFLNLIKANDLRYLWLPGSDFFLNNISRPRTYLSFILTFGIPGALSAGFIIYFWGKNKTILKKHSSLIAGIAISILLWIYSVLSAYSDGRFIWPSIVFSIPLSMTLLQFYRQSYENVPTSR